MALALASLMAISTGTTAFADSSQSSAVFTDGAEATGNVMITDDGDYVVNDLVVLEQGYYESENLKGTTKNVFIPIEPDTKKRLPSEKISEGTLMEIDGENYRIHVSNNEYSATLEEN